MECSGFPKVSMSKLLSSGQSHSVQSPAGQVSVSLDSQWTLMDSLRGTTKCIASHRSHFSWARPLWTSADKIPSTECWVPAARPPPTSMLHASRGAWGKWLKVCLNAIKDCVNDAHKMFTEFLLHSRSSTELLAAWLLRYTWGFYDTREILER